MADVVLRGPVTGPRRLGQLPAEASSFVGRAAELTGIAALLGNARMVTVTGAPGVGKTRVSLRAAMTAAGQFPDGAWLVDLAPLTEPGQLAPAVAVALGLPPADETTLLAKLRGRRLLLILDTCEHLVDDCAAFAEALLRAAPGATLLATSRQPLDAQGEHAFPIQPLAVESDAADLLAQRAAAVVPGFAVTPRNRADVVRLCRLLDGIPLAIELAAVRLRALPLPELVSQLESGMGTLSLSRRGASPRHQTLRAAVQWSYDLCTEAEQALWERLSVFGGSFDAAGAEQVCAGDALAREQVIHTLIGLVDKSVLRRDDTAPARYLLPGAQRVFGAERLAEADEQERFRGRLTGYCLAAARRHDEPLRALGGDQAAAVRGLHREHANITAALDFALGARGAPAQPPEAAAPADLVRRRLGAELAVRLTGYWLISGLLEDGIRWLGCAADALPETAPERMRALAARGRLATFRGDLTGAIADIGESIRLAGQDDGAELDIGRGYLYLNLALTLDGQFDEALRAGERARVLLSAPSPRPGLIALEAQLGLRHQLAGRAAEAIACCDRGLAMLDGDDAERWVSGYLHLVAGLAEAQLPGREQASGTSLSQALTAAHELGDVVGMAYAIEATGWQAARRGRHERAAWLLGAADRLWAEIGCRLSGSVLAEECRQRAAGAAREALGERRYSAARSHGGALDLDAVVAGAADPDFDPRVQRGGDPVPVDPGPGNAGTGAAPQAAGPAAVLTRREREIADLVATGLSNREVADRLFISKRTVDAHVEHIFGKLGISSRVQLTVLVAGPGH
ncbi:MAG TPA: LuxR C-terminal-related transcriptional regulator [Trebonia sp.]|nr:LuxR C-terminal-related transcriptional regulator [Trebonia sp.]